MIGAGGMATVYKGYRADIDRYVAIKVLPPHPGLDTQFVERFKLEARTIARLQHPHILPLYDYGAEGDILFLVTAYIDGGSLADRIDAGPLRMSETARLLRQAAVALDYAHRQGVIHRDIKPANMLLDKEGNLLLADFGIARLSSNEGGKLTATGGLLGTPAYMSPEQARGDDVTPGTDVYALGVVLYEMLTGKQPYEAETPMKVLLKHITDPVPRLSAVDPNRFNPAMELVLARALAKSPTNRYQTATEMADDLDQAIQSVTSGVGTGPLKLQPAPDPTTLKRPEGFPTAFDPAVVGNQPPSATGSAPSPFSGTNPQLTGTQPGTTTIIQQSGISPTLVTIGFAVIGILLLLVVLLLLSNRPPVEALTVIAATSTTAASTDAPTAEAVALQPTATPQPTFGRLSFSSTEQTGDTLTLSVNNLALLPEGETYVGWLVNTLTNEALLIGPLTLDASGSGVLPPFVDADGRLLLMAYNGTALTRETEVSEAPKGSHAYSASLPPELMTAFMSVFVTDEAGVSQRALGITDGYSAPNSSDDDPKAGLLAGAIGEAERAAQHAGLAARATSPGGMHTHNEHTINILRGTQDDLDGSGAGQNPGFGVGLLPLISLMKERIQLVVEAPAASRELQGNLELMRVCLDNAELWANQTIEHEQAMLAATDLESVAQIALESTQLSAQVVNGRDDNGNGQVEPFENECGLQQIEGFGLLAGTMLLTQALPES
jgi:serine/threonine protein kinase